MKTIKNHSLNEVNYYEDSLVDELINVDWLLTGVMTFESSFLSREDETGVRFKKGMWAFTRLGQILKVSRKPGSKRKCQSGMKKNNYSAQDYY